MVVDNLLVYLKDRGFKKGLSNLKYLKEHFDTQGCHYYCYSYKYISSQRALGQFCKHWLHGRKFCVNYIDGSKMGEEGSGVLAIG